MKKRLIAILCLLALLVVPVLSRSSAATTYSDVYLLGVNDTVMLNFITAELMPFRRGGTIYAPYTLLDNRDLGLSYTIDRTNGVFTISNRRQSLAFDLNRSGAEDGDGNVYYNERVISRNGVVFFPLRFVTTYFGLTYSFYNLVLPYGTVPIARISTGQAALSDTQFGASAAALVATPVRQYLDSQQPAAPSAQPSQPPAGSEPPAPTHVNLSFAVVCTDGAGFQTLLDAFASARYSALFLFSPEDLLTRDADVRAAAAAGHQIGILLSADAPEEDFRLGNERLRHILRAEVSQVAFSSGGARRGNWRLWTGNVTPRGGSVTTQAKNLSDDVDALTDARVTLTDSRLTAQAVQRNIRAWSRQPYTLLTPTG